MSLLPENARHYIEKFGVKGPWQLSENTGKDFGGAVVIPSLAEGDSLFYTLDSLAENLSIHTEFIVLVVVNNAEDASSSDIMQNQADLHRLAVYAANSPLNLAWIDASSSGLSIPRKRAGVGFARKLGLDLALTVLDWRKDPLLICLDADTLVETNYFQTIKNHFQRSSLGAAVLPYRHQPGKTPEQQAAIDRYEIYLRSYVYGLRLAGSPYAFNAVGSAMACRATAYVRCGGMNTRKAGEDFYFLQKLAKTDGVALLAGTTVWPAPRISDRVPFGTGRSMLRMLDDDYRGVLVYPFEVFRILKQWLKIAEEHLFDDPEAVVDMASGISPILSGYLETLKWGELWPTLQATHKKEQTLQNAFHAWFDGFKSLRLIHLLCEHGYERGEPELLLPDYFGSENIECPPTVAAMLEKLRHYDNVQ